MSLIVRDATLEDAEDILAIYNHAAINTTAVWTDGPADLASRRAWMSSQFRFSISLSVISLVRLATAGRSSLLAGRLVRCGLLFPVFAIAIGIGCRVEAAAAG